VNVSLFITCYNDTLFPNTGKAVVAVLERLGHTVDFPPAQTCCGQMHYNTGYQNDARRMMLHFLEVFRDAETICVPSASCVAMIREHFPKMAAASPTLPWAARWRRCCRGCTSSASCWWISSAPWIPARRFRTR
jgi:L-lactate dehydrogenase complex protein LldE